MTDFVEVSRLHCIPPGTATVVKGAQGPVALFNLAGRIFAVDNSCARCGSSLAAGTLNGADVTCSGCDWRYDVTTGSVNGVPALQIDTFDVRVVDSSVMIATTLTWDSRGNDQERGRR